jgi:UDP-N-acetylmuramoylalanine--D-glutamate ligase
VILGGRFKGGDFGELRAALVERGALVIAIGEATPLVRQALAPAVTVHEASDMVAAVRTAFAAASPGDTVLLAPACASFDMFKDYAERGRVFKQSVAKLQAEWSGTREQ